jgi:type IV secretion system protein VirB9
VVWGRARSVEAALKAALQTPEPWRFEGGVLMYDAVPGARYRVDVTPGRVTTLRFSRGETLFGVLSGLPKCGEVKAEEPEEQLKCLAITETQSGEGSGQQWMVGIRPAQAGLQTNLLITTSAGAYDVEIRTTARPIPVVAWQQPMPVARQDEPPAALIGLGYTLTPRTQRPPWMPLRAWDDQAHLWIEFPAGIDAQEYPVAHGVGHDGAEVLVNYTVHGDGRVMVIDGTWDGLTLRVGSGATAALVDLRRHTGYRYVTCPGAECPEGWQAVRR